MNVMKVTYTAVLQICDEKSLPNVAISKHTEKESAEGIIEEWGVPPHTQQHTLSCRENTCTILTARSNGTRSLRRMAATQYRCRRMSPKPLHGSLGAIRLRETWTV